MINFSLIVATEAFVSVEVCPDTGLAVIPASGQVLFRLAKPSYGVLNPLRRSPSTSDPRTSWNRFDLPGEQTAYAAETPQGAYGELLGSLKKAKKAKASDYLDDVGEADLEDLIREDWVSAGKPPPHMVDLNWLYEFRLYMIGLPKQGWFVDIEHSRTVAYLNAHIPSLLWEEGTDSITVSHVRSESRFVTTNLVEEIAKSTVRGGVNPLGVRFGSKHGSEWICWAIWLRGNVQQMIASDGGMDVSSPVQNPDLASVLEGYGLTV